MPESNSREEDHPLSEELASANGGSSEEDLRGMPQSVLNLGDLFLAASQESEAGASDEAANANTPQVAPDQPQIGRSSPQHTVESHSLEDVLRGSAGRLVLLSDGLQQLTVIMPNMARANLSEAEVEKIGTTWTHGNDSEVPSFGTAQQTMHNGHADDCLALTDVHDTCGICMGTFDEGDKLTALPCATRGCSSVWHLPCIHKWLNEGHAPSCPLCRAEIESDLIKKESSTNIATIAFLGGDNGRGSSSLTSELVGFLFRAMLMERFAALEAASTTRIETRASLIEQDDELPREVPVASA